MPQVFQVLRCYKCLTFQVHQTKKSNKFSCKICDEKQSIKRHYGIGIAKDCRMHVQKLNKMRGEKDEILEDDSDDNEEANISNSIDDTANTTYKVKKPSKWLLYIDKQIEETDSEDKMISETNPCNTNKSWPRHNPYHNYMAKKNILLKGSNYNENNLNLNENILNNDNIKNDFGKRPLSENEDDCQIGKVSKTHDINLPRHNNNLQDYISISKPPKLQTAKVNRSSKWAQFIERDDEIDEQNCDDEEIVNFPKNKQPLFSLCDENDIDDVLDI